MRNVKDKIKVNSWSGVIEAKVELEMAWFRVRGIPYDKRSKKTLAYVGSLVSATKEVDRSTLHRADYVRIKIAARDVSKVPEVAEGAILPYIYDFYYEREVEWGNVANDITAVKISDPKGGDAQPSPNKPRVEEKSSHQSNMQIELFSAKKISSDESRMLQSTSESAQGEVGKSGTLKKSGSSSAPPPPQIKRKWT
jgi:hypothetical protein